MAELHWKFLQRRVHEGRSYGNSALYATPQSIPSLVRETGQNSLDAASSDEGVVMRYTLFELPPSSARRAQFTNALRFENELRPHILASSSGVRESQTSVRLASAIKELDASGSVLRVLRIEDYGAGGLRGDEFGPHGSFSALVRDVENSDKADQTAGGSFGLGAKTLWSCSKLLTVLFSSRVPERPNEIRVIGKADLGYHAIDGQAEHGFSGPGFFGMPIQTESDGAESAWLGDSDRALQDMFLDRRPPPGAPDIFGTTALILAFHDPTMDEEDGVAMAKSLRRAVAENFWPAILNGQLRASVEHHSGDSREPLSEGEVDPDDYVPSLADAFRQFRSGAVQPKLEQSGDVVCVSIPFAVPATRPEGRVVPQHSETAAEATLLIRLAETSPQDAAVLDHVGYARGRAMITQYDPKRNLGAGARPFHAVLLAGRLAGDTQAHDAAEKFLRYAEPPSHDNWTLWGGLRARYAHGAGSKLRQLFAAVTEALIQHVAAPPGPADEGPDVLRQLFQLPQVAEPKKTAWTISGFTSKVVGNEFHVTAVVDLRRRGEGRLAPRLGVAKESGRATAAEWLELRSDDAALEGEDFLITPKMRRIRFSGRAVSPLTGLDMSRCAVELSLRGSIEEEK